MNNLSPLWKLNSTYQHRKGSKKSIFKEISLIAEDICYNGYDAVWAA